MNGGSPERKGSGASAEEKNEDDCDVDTTRALAADCKRVEFEGDTRSLRFGLVQKTVRPFGKVVKATINPPDEGWLLLKTAEMAAKVAHTMENPRFVEAADGVDATWVCTFKEGEPVPDPYAKKSLLPAPGLGPADALDPDPVGVVLTHGRDLPRTIETEGLAGSVDVEAAILDC
eukprot:CAMPEP_0185754126 /NCGR_PEP_ID=MMETSP1174-20130828/12776_1 /TAXON_ID=35687 /ORGANISM="Dictyocha speculum, Strain CCMP1381" /LENGTH=174 /DNA_ID=CAMNT_0028432209 /DNA_START=602 /DNA_END=1127 /DNA_ORIENTATION=+